MDGASLLRAARHAGWAAWLAGVWALVCLPGMGQREVTNVVEARVAITAREMWRAGEWIVPTMNGQPRLQKPPLAYWAAESAAWLRGAFNDDVLRFPFALLAGGAALFTAAMGRRLGSSSRGIVAGAILLTSALFVKEGRMANADVALLFASAGAWNYYLGARLEARSAHRLLLYLFLGLGALAKGPVILAIVVIPALLEAVFTRSVAPLLPFWSGWGLAAFLALGLAWPVAVILHLADRMPAGEAVRRWWLESFGKMLPSDGIDDGYQFQRHAEAFYFYLPRLPAVLGFWIVLLPAAVIDLARRRSASLPAIWTAATLLFFSVVSEKKIAYLLPMLPAVSLWLAQALEDLHARRGEWFVRAARWLSYAACGALVAVAVSLLWPVPPDAGIGPGWLEDWRSLRAEAGSSVVSLATIIAAAVFGVRWTLRRPGIAGPAAVAATALALSILPFEDARAALEPQRSFREPGRSLGEQLAAAPSRAALGALPGALVYYLDVPLKVCAKESVEAMASLEPGTLVIARDRALARIGQTQGLEKGSRLAAPLDRFVVKDRVEAGTGAQEYVILLLEAR